MKIRTLFASLFLLILGFATPGQGNDSTAELDTGGLVLARTGDIKMVSEHLQISLDRIAIDYVFRNRTDKDITTLVAFPLPDLAPPGDGDRAIPRTTSGADFVGFRTLVNGLPVATKVEQRALVAGLDQTSVLATLGIPFEHFAPDANKRLAGLDEATIAALTRLGIVRFESYDIGQGMKRYVKPNWTLRTTFYWEQTFPAKKDVRISHSYEPAAGSTAGTVIGSDYFEKHVRKNYERQYCLNQAFVDQVKTLQSRTAKADDGYVTEQWIDYILRTGGNWAGGTIGSFKLTVDAGAEGLIAMCHGKLKSVGDGKYEWVEDSYWPDHDIKLLFVIKRKRN